MGGGKVMKLKDLLKDLELGKVYTDKDRPPFKVNEKTSYKQIGTNKNDGYILHGKDIPEEELSEIEDHEGSMAKSQLERSMKYSKMIYDMIDNVGQGGEVEFPAWVQSKLTKSMDYLQSVFNYLDGKDGIEDKFQNKKNSD